MKQGFQPSIPNLWVLTKLVIFGAHLRAYWKGNARTPPLVEGAKEVGTEMSKDTQPEN